MGLDCGDLASCRVIAWSRSECIGCVCSLPLVATLLIESPYPLNIDLTSKSSKQLLGNILVVISQIMLEILHTYCVLNYGLAECSVNKVSMSCITNINDVSRML